MKHRRTLLLIALLGAAAFGLPGMRGATITVTELGDGYNVHTNLRQALAEANDGDTIEFDPLLGGRDLPIAVVLGELVINKSVTIRWVPTSGYPPYLGVDAQHGNRVFSIRPGKTVTISGLTIKNGEAPPPYRAGGGIYNDHANLTLNNCTISGNSAAQGWGGGIYSDGSGGSATLTIADCTISGNSAWPGGGIYNYFGTVTITNSTLSGNSDTGQNAGGAIANQGTLTISSSTFTGNASTSGGAIYNAGFNPTALATLAITNSTFTGNSASRGGAIYNDFAGTATMTNCTFSGNSAGGLDNIIYNGTGGAIWNAETLTVTSCTLSGNSATIHGGGIYNGPSGSAETILKIGTTILNAGPSGENIYNDNTYYPATVTSLGYNLSSDNGGGHLTAAGDRVNTDPKLGPLQNNGGPTFTHLPASNSPAIDASNPALSMDQRGAGFARAVNGRADIGAVEVQAEPSPTPSPTPTPRPTPPRGRH